MKAIAFGLRALWRDVRSGALVVLTLALTVAAASVTAVGFLTDRVRQAVTLQANEILAADIRLSSAEPLDSVYLDYARSINVQHATTLNFPSVIFHEEHSALAQINAVSAGYPLRGRLKTSDRVEGRAQVNLSLPDKGQVWLDSALLARLNAEPGDHVDLGAATFLITQVLRFRPDQPPGFSGFAPSLMMHIEDLEQTGLVQTGSRVSYNQLYAGSPTQIKQMSEYLRSTVDDRVRFRSQSEAGELLTNTVERAGRFLALASLVSLLLAAVAVAMSARLYMRQRLDTAALMKSIGARQRFIVMGALTQLLAIGLLASIFGAVIGLIGESVLISVLSGVLREALPGNSWQPVVLGAGTVFSLLIGFALPPIFELGKTPPARVLRKDMQPPGMSAWVSYGLALCSLTALVYWSVRDVYLLLIILGGVACSALLLFWAGKALVNVLSRSLTGVGVAWRYGIANVARRGRESAIQIAAFGLGLMALLVLTVIRNDLLHSWQATIADDAPNQFLINIQPSERQQVASMFARYGVAQMNFTPLVRARLVSINGQHINTIKFSTPRGLRMAKREANLTYAKDMVPSNRLLSGRWWSGDGVSANEVSVEGDVAEDLDIKLNDQLIFDVAGESVGAKVTSLRKVKWDSFEPNFFMVFSPATLASYPKTYISSVHLEPNQRGVVKDLAQVFPSISVIDLQAIIDQARSIIDKAALALEVVFVFTLLAGLVVLFASVQSTLEERRYESALLRTFGASTKTVMAGLVSEFAVLGLIAGLFGALGASAVGSLAATRLFDLPMEFNSAVWWWGAVSGVMIVSVSGLLATYKTLDEPPVRILD